MNLFFGYLLVINGLVFILMGIDKYQAVKQRFRIPESWLLALGILGGGCGGWIGMVLFRHKIRKPYFKVVFTAGIIAMAYIYWRFF
ncbi:DUF1294 domain-containing protein [Aerococcaceae bacterium zg-ZUI334]|uniref:DUF1294 domain-containing protein n=1 Tax=Aerococcaceae bacterium zg-252 TaxID=2796928 RepID=UPI001BA06344|nr:DUF1294 domain-containing protein [Aerococcaceae bacterium zg-ZUI334]